jgi:hypothetical protein
VERKKALLRCLIDKVVAGDVPAGVANLRWALLP